MNYQESQWAGKFGTEYTDRNPQTFDDMNQLCINNFGISQEDIFKQILPELSADAKILEVGCNVGCQLQILQQMGFTNLYGIDIQSYAIEKAKELSKGINIIQGSAFDLPFKDDYFDLVFTSGMLIHIQPERELFKVLNEINRVSKQYIMGFECYSPEWDTVNYRGSTDLYWKGDYAEIYQNGYIARLLQETRYSYLDDSRNVDSIFLLEKVK